MVVKIAAALAMAFGISGATHAAIVSVNTFDQGWYRDNGTHDPENINTITGPASIATLRSFYAFDLSALSGATITSATITFQANNGHNTGPTLSKMLGLFDYSGSIAALLDGAGGLAAFDDLGSGNSYGTAVIEKPTDAPVDMPGFTVVLSGTAIADLMAAIQSEDQQFVIGAALSNEVLGLATDALWAASGAATAASLHIETAAANHDVPEPASIALLGLGLAGLAAARRRQPA